MALFRSRKFSRPLCTLATLESIRRTLLLLLLQRVRDEIYRRHGDTNDAQGRRWILDFRAELISASDIEFSLDLSFTKDFVRE